MPEVILHHYYAQASPFSERVRLVLGLKGLSWGSVVTGYVPPRPHLEALAGGYRRIPVLQIGADVYCDTRCIVDELERRWPRPTLYPNGEAGLAAMLTSWAQGPLLTHAFCLYVGADTARIPQDYLRDRIEITEGALDVTRLRAAVPTLRAQVRAQLDWIETQLGDGRAFLLGAQAGLADITVYQNLWFLEAASAQWPALAAPFGRLRAWMAGVAAIGHGRAVATSAAAALERARSSEPETEPRADPAAGLRPGDRVAVLPDDYAKLPVTGEVVAASAQRIAIRRRDPDLGELVLHFPRVGFVVQPAA